MKVSYLDLDVIHKDIQCELDAAYRGVMDSQWFIGGKADADFEQKFADYCGVRACAGTGNGLDALRLISLERPYEGLYVPNNMWREMYDFSSDAVLMVLALEVYREEDYIRDYDKFLEMVEYEK